MNIEFRGWSCSFSLLIWKYGHWYFVRIYSTKYYACELKLKLNTVLNNKNVVL